MTDKYVLKKDHLLPLLRKLKKNHRLIAPLQNRHGDTLFTEIDNLDTARIDLENQPQNSLKQFFFPQQKVLFIYSNPARDSYHFEPVAEESGPTLYFGVRSCDLSAILYMDVVFLKDAKDPNYQQKRQNSILVGLNCNDPFANCFCNATRNGPFLDFGFDLQLTDLGDRFLVEFDRSRGQEIISEWRQFFSRADDKDAKAQYQVFLEARGRFSLQVHLDLAARKLADDKVPESVWHELSMRCQDCGGCAYICPTCTCFTIRDQQTSDNEGERIRSWDACTFSGFTRMAGDHNPVDRQLRGIEQRFRHKLQFDVKKDNRPSCVGCGRCVNICFGGTDIVRFINMTCYENI
jgi:sulfhydrogenase subunit beta (sulfur reductase)